MSNKIIELYLQGSYCDQKLNNSEVNVVSLVGTNDKVLNQEAFKDAKSNLGSNSSAISIEGGNHSQFGDYGFQEGDGIATISREEQIGITVSEIINLFAGK